MSAFLALSDDGWDLDRLRLTPEMVGDLTGRRPPPRHRPGDPFIKGPIPHAWIASACRLPGVGLHVAMAFRFLCCRFRGENRWGLDAISLDLQVSPDSARRGLHAAEQAGLLVAVREPGCKLVVSVSEPVLTGSGPVRRPLYGPIPWAWWLPASRLPGKSLQVASACWLLAGWYRSAEFELALDDWAELGLSRFSTYRGLECLRGVGLVSVARRSGRSPSVSILDTSRPRPVQSGGSLEA